MVHCDLNCDLCIVNSPDRVADLELIDGVLAGDGSKFEILLHRYCPLLLRIARRILEDEAEAEDAVQQACINAYLHLGHFEGRSSVATWLTAITVNEARARLRPRRVNDQLDETVAAHMRSNAFGPEEQCLAAELASRLEAGIEALPWSYRQVFELRRDEQLSTADVATRLGVAPDVVKTRLYRARKLLRKRVGGRE